MNNDKSGEDNEFEKARRKIEEADKFSTVKNKAEFLKVVEAMLDIVHAHESSRQELQEKIKLVFEDPTLLSEIFPEGSNPANFRNALKRISNGPQN
jgi:hypothetical protein